MAKDPEFKICVPGLTSDQVEAFDDYWRQSRAPRFASRSDALRHLMAAAAAGRVSIQPEAPAHG